MIFKSPAHLIGTAVIAGGILIAGTIGFAKFTERVPEGKVAVVYSPNGGAKEVFDPGWHLKGFFDKTQQYPTRITIVKSKVAATTSDGKKITMPVTYEMKVDKAKVLNIFKELGSQDVEQIQEGYLYKKLFKASRDSISTYSVLDIYGAKSTKASSEITEAMAKSSEKLGFIVSDVTLGSPDVDAATQSAIDSRVQAAQKLEKLNLDKKIAEAEAEKKKIEAEGQAQADIAVAEGEAESAIVKAKGEAEANKLINQSMTQKVLDKMEMEARKSHGWVTIQGATPLVESK